MSHPYSPDHPNAHGPDTTESEPEDVADLYQEAPAVDVKGEVEVVNPVRVKLLPSRHANGFRIVPNVGETIPLVGANPRRARMLIVAVYPAGTTSLGFYFGERDSVNSGRAPLWPAGVPLELRHCEEVYVRMEGTPTGTHYISFMTEDWAD